MTRTLGDLLTEVSRTSGLDRVAALAASADIVIDQLEEARKESGATHFRLDNLTQAEVDALAQILFLGQGCWKHKKGLDKWIPYIQQHPEVLEIAGLVHDLERLLTDAIEATPDMMFQVADDLNPLHPTGDTLSAFWLGDDLPSLAVPPGHILWQALGVSNKGQWQSLPEDEKVKRTLCLLARDKTFLATGHPKPASEGRVKTGQLKWALSR